jgi:YD repeat-containing protein
MRISPMVCFLPLALVCFVSVAVKAQSRQSPLLEKSVSAAVRGEPRNTAVKPSARPSDTGIREIIEDKYKKRYEAWKAEFLASDIGRKEWDSFEHSDHFLLTITISDENARGGGTSKYKWNDAGELVAATITLGDKIHEGYPSPVYYPVMNSLAPGNSSYTGSGAILAATKIAHEFGHVTRMAKTNPAVYLLQTQLIPRYNSILLSNGRNTRDPRLIELAQRMGGTPVEIWEDREYWGEVGSMLFLRDITDRQSSQCALFNRIREFVELYAMPYRDRFAEVAGGSSPSYTCAWQ